MKSRIFRAFCCVFICFSLLCGCGSATPEAEDGGDGAEQQNPLDNVEGDTAVDMTEEIDADSTTLSDPYGFFRDSGLMIFGQTLREGENTLISPLSICGALSMAAEGAVGDTQAQIVRAVGGNDSWELDVLFNEYAHSLPQGDKCKVSLANSVWIRDLPGFEIESVYADNCLSRYDAELYQEPFDESTLKTINRWVEEKTDGMIAEVLNGIPRDAMMYLINALAFDAEWKAVYSDIQVRDGIFTAGDGTEQEAEMMYSQEAVYLEDGEAVGFLKYYADERYAFLAMLPGEGLSVIDYAASLAEDPYHAVPGVLASAREITVNAVIPKFACSYDVSLKDALMALGMVDAFDPEKADFSDICKNSELYVSEVLHKTYIAVDERGTKAGAVTAVEMAERGAMQTDEKTVRLDRPFLYMIFDCEEEIPLFIGILDHLE